jgi:GxxExxY protein
MEENQLSQIIVDAAIEVHRTLGGPGLLESVYRGALALEICERGPAVESEKLVPIKYKGQLIGTPLRLDLLVGQLVIVECKAVIEYNPIFESQVLTYLRLTGLKLGLVINFGQRLVKNGIHRVVNGL